MLLHTLYFYPQLANTISLSLITQHPRQYFYIFIDTSIFPT
jgi:hypothetical protein